MPAKPGAGSSSAAKCHTSKVAQSHTPTGKKACGCKVKGKAELGVVHEHYSTAMQAGNALNDLTIILRNELIKAGMDEKDRQVPPK